MNKCHTNINWVNDQTPALNDTNLNYMDGCIDIIDDRVVAIANDPPANALKAEGWAVGEQSGTPVTSGSPYYENNSKYYSQQSAAENLVSEGYANGTQNGTPVTSGSPYYENNAKYWKEQAQAIAGQTLGGLTDVTITTPSDGDVLTYDSNSGEWGNKALAVGSKAEKTDLTSIIATGSTNTTGAQIPNGAYFYLNGVFCRAIADIATNATFTKNTNYKETTVGAEISGGIVRMSVNSTMTYASALNAFAALIDFSKITPKSSFRIIETSMISCFSVTGIMSNELRVTRTNNGTSIKCIGFYIKASSSMAYTTQATTSGTTYTDDSSSALYSGYQAFELEY